ncbi:MULTISPECIES: daptide-type RiPP [Streptomyces]|uniref:daptide-type RiPP n=1 Tax=Streptomyces TaxID=1883 RepID=UPI000A96E71E|nr:MULTISPECIES: daptide-type RiPP [Streptomyces]MDX6758063.1 daptide-type RiPP [Streptomyces sp. F8]
MQAVFEPKTGFDLKDNGPALELGMQELEAMEAPGFYTGFKDGLMFSIAVGALSVAAST